MSTTALCGKLRKSFSRHVYSYIFGFVLVTILAIINPVQAATITVTTDVDELNNPGPDTGCSLREAIQAVNTGGSFGGCPAGSAGDTIELPAGVFKLSITGTGEDANDDGDLDILESVTIQGVGVDEDGIHQTVIQQDADNERVIHVISGLEKISLTVMDVEIREGEETNFPAIGGGIFAQEADLTVIGSLITHNFAETGGAGIAVDSGGDFVDPDNVKLLVQDSEIIINDTLGTGGAILLGQEGDQCDAVLDNTLVQLNEAAVGGGIFGLAESLCQLTFINNTRFDQNSALVGGGVMAVGGHVDLVSHGTKYTFNDGSIIGGAMFFGTLIVSGEFIDDEFSDNISALIGGGIFSAAFENSLLIRDTDFLRNAVVGIPTAGTTAAGGAMAIIGAGLLDLSDPITFGEANLIIDEGSRFSDNRAVHGAGGAIVVATLEQDIHISDTTFERNIAETAGGAFIVAGLNENSYLVMEDFTFIENQATDLEIGIAGGLWTLLLNRIEMTRGSFIGNVASIDGGAMVLSTVRADDFEPDSSVTMKNCTLAENYADFNGGAIVNGLDLQGTPLSGVPLDIVNSTIAWNHADKLGGGIFAAGGEVEQGIPQAGLIQMHNVILAENTARELGQDCFDEDAASDPSIVSIGHSTIGIEEGEDVCIPSEVNADDNDIAGDLADPADPGLEDFLDESDGSPGRQTIALEPDSTSIDTADAAACFDEVLQDQILVDRFDIPDLPENGVTPDFEVVQGSVVQCDRGAREFVNLCGNGVIDEDVGEECDDMPGIDNPVDNLDYCLKDCRLNVCGDGHLNQGGDPDDPDNFEECEDGNTVDGDGCSSDCKLEELFESKCGDGLIDLNTGEECDDGNNIDDDECPNDCLLPTELEGKIIGIEGGGFGCNRLAPVQTSSTQIMMAISLFLMAPMLLSLWAGMQRRRRSGHEFGREVL